MVRKVFWPVVAAAVFALLAGLAVAGNGRTNDKTFEYAIGLWGDLPYSDTQASTGVPNLIADMNRERLAFTVHDGDIKSGSSRCDNPVYAQAKTFFNSLDAPAAYTPGDNEWTDCDRPSAGPYSSRERLEYIRAQFFDTPFSFGRHRMRQDVQSPPYVENRRWQTGPVTYATLNVPGSCNNLCDVAPDPAEEQARDAANIAWLRQTFALARQRGSVAVMLIFQANPGWDESDATRDVPTRNPNTLAETDARPDGYRNFLTALREETIAFGKPVDVVHGDSHYFRIDKPLLDAQGRRVLNFTRVETFGDNQANGNNDAQWVKVTVDPRSEEVFSYQPQLVPGNR
jgi:hypothetical protein